MSASAAIQQVLTRIAWGTDLRDADLIASCYTEDATFSVTGPTGRVVEGRAAILAGVQRTWSSTPPSKGKHLITNVLVERETADEAHVRSYKTVVRDVDGVPQVVSSGWYQDRLVLRDGEWRIQERALTNDVQA